MSLELISLEKRSVSNQWLSQHWETVTVFLEENRQHIFYLLAFYVVTIALFIERFMRELILYNIAELTEICSTD